LVLATPNPDGTAIGAIQAGRLDPRQLLGQDLTAVTSGGGGNSGGTENVAGATTRPVAFPAWSDIGTALFGSGNSVTVWTPVGTTPGRYLGAELPEAALGALLAQPVSSFPDAYPVLLSPSGRWLAADSQAVHDFGLPQSYLGTPMAEAPVS